MLSRFYTIPACHRQTDGQNCYTVKLRYNGLLGTIEKSLLYPKSVISKLGPSPSSLNIYRHLQWNATRIHRHGYAGFHL